jgi:hypothetical protein
MAAPILFGWPTVFYIKAMKNNQQEIPMADKVGCAFMLGVLPALMIGGLVSAFDDIINGGNEATPFGC